MVKIVFVKQLNESVKVRDDWTAEKVVNYIRGKYKLDYGSLEEDGVAFDDIIATATGQLEFVGGRANGNDSLAISTEIF
jgi:hypothetical protein